MLTQYEYLNVGKSNFANNYYVEKPGILQSNCNIVGIVQMVSTVYIICTKIV